ncbi:MAG: hypothetical protein WDM76_19880 [Limisphaerales bacterium]
MAGYENGYFSNERANAVISSRAIAERLSGSFQIVTPLNVLQIIRSNSLSEDVRTMMSDEEVRDCKAVADRILEITGKKPVESEQTATNATTELNK